MLKKGKLIMQIKYLVKELTPYKKYKDIYEIDINGIKTRFFNGEYKFLLEMTNEKYELIKEWIKKNMVPYLTRKTFNPYISSYGLKHNCEADIDEYVCNGDLKYALSEMGYEHDPKEEMDINYYYKLSSKYAKERNKRLKEEATEAFCKGKYK